MFTHFTVSSILSPALLLPVQKLSQMHRTKTIESLSATCCAMRNTLVAERRRRRPSWLLSAGAVLAVILNSVDALSAVISAKSARASVAKSSAAPSVAPIVSNDEAIAKTRSSRMDKRGLHPFVTNSENDDDDHLYLLDDNQIESIMRNFHNLKDSTGSEILQAELQLLVDEGPARFLEHHAETELERVAMTSITEQLSQAAIQALLQSQQQNEDAVMTKKKKTTTNRLNFAKSRVTSDEELRLARIIRTGAALYKAKADEEMRLGRSLTRAEWAEAVGLTPKLLRQTVSVYRKAKHDLVSANLGLVHAVVNQQYSNGIGNGITKEELVQEGSLGLLRAAELFDPTRGVRFSTYAVVWIKGVLSNTHLPELVRLPSREKAKWNKICKAQKDLKEFCESNATPTLEELSFATGLSVTEILDTQRQMSHVKSVLSLDYERTLHSRSGGESNLIGDGSNRLDKNDDQEHELAERTQLQADLIAAMARNLDAREARLVRLRYGLSDGRCRTLQECADAMGLSYTRVHQLSKRCLQKLREAAEAESLQEYLLTIA